MKRNKYKDSYSNSYEIHLDILQIFRDDEPLRRVLKALNTAIIDTDRNIRRASKVDDDEYRDSVIEDEVAVTEDLIGCGFVACQAYITAVVSCITKLHEKALRVDISHSEIMCRECNLVSWPVTKCRDCGSKTPIFKEVIDPEFGIIGKGIVSVAKGIAAVGVFLLSGSLGQDTLHSALNARDALLYKNSHTEEKKGYYVCPICDKPWANVTIKVCVRCNNDWDRVVYTAKIQDHVELRNTLLYTLLGLTILWISMKILIGSNLLEIVKKNSVAVPAITQSIPPQNPNSKPTAAPVGVYSCEAKLHKTESKTKANKENLAIFEAIRNIDIDSIKALIKKNPNVLNTRIKYSEVIKDSYKSRNGPKTFYCEHLNGVKRNFSPLSYATYKRYTEIVEELLQAGAVVNKMDDEGWTCLHWAAFTGDLEIAKLLVKNGADIDAVDKHMEKASTIAKIRNHSGVYDLLK